MRSATLLLLSACFAAALACAPGYSTWFNGWCFEAASKWPVTPDSARSYCTPDGAHAPFIKSQQENDWFVTAMKQNVGSPQVFLGLSCVGGVLKWDDGSAVEYTNFPPDPNAPTTVAPSTVATTTIAVTTQGPTTSTSAPPSTAFQTTTSPTPSTPQQTTGAATNGPTIQQTTGMPFTFWPPRDTSSICSWPNITSIGFVIDVSSGYWTTISTSQYLNYVVCQGEKRSDATCDDFDVLPNGKSCFKLYTSTVSWNQAEQQCASGNAHLLSVHNKDMNDFVKRTAIANGLTSGIHIGLNNKYDTDNYTWTDGTPLDYHPWAQNFPDSRLGACVAMQTSFLAGYWMNTDCQSTALPYICHREQDQTPGVHSGCANKVEYFDGDEVFSPSFPKPGDTSHCTYMAMANGTANGVQVEVLLFESNSCCDALNLYSGAFGNNLVGSLSGYIAPGTKFHVNAPVMRLEWNATSAANVRGFHLKVSNY